MSNKFIKSIRFHNFKALYSFTVSFQELSVLIGPNNCGKSTIINAFRLLHAGIRIAKIRRAEGLDCSKGIGKGHKISQNKIPTSLENAHTDYNDEESYIQFKCKDDIDIEIFFPPDGGCSIFFIRKGVYIEKPNDIKKFIYFAIEVVPVLGPLEYEESLLEVRTVNDGLSTHRASRHFRNFWYYNKDGFESFSSLLKKTWPGMEIERPEIDAPIQKLYMFCVENRIRRELSWAGFGFQIWCQLLTHISRAKERSVVVIDEPEIYLHPDVQRQLLYILKDISCQVVLATHSAEIVGEADMSDILLVDKQKRSAKQLKDVSGLQEALDFIGSVHNVKLAQLARSGRILFVEGPSDVLMLRLFARRLGYSGIHLGEGFTFIEAQGFSSWQKLYHFGWGVEKVFSGQFKLGAIYDRDFWPDDKLSEISTDFEKVFKIIHFYKRKEIENYLFDFSNLERCCNRKLSDKKKNSVLPVGSIAKIFDEVTSEMKSYMQSQYISRYVESYKGGKDKSTVTEESLLWFNERWDDIERRIEIIPGKDVLRAMNRKFLERFSFSITPALIIKSYELDSIPAEIKWLLDKIEEFRKIL